MNSHFQPYSELSTSHSPSPENGVCYTNLSETNGGSGGGGNAGGGISAPSTNNVNTVGGSNGNGNAGGNNGIGERISNNSSSISCNGSNMVVHHQNGHSLSLNGSVGVGGGGGGAASDGNNSGNGCGGNGNGNGTRSNQPAFHQLNSNNNCAVKQCSGCGGKIIERYFLHALDRYWHNSCLKCYCCGAMLADIGSSCYTRGGMILCKSDYSRMFGTAPCSACGQTIAPNEFVMRTTSPISSQQKQQQQQQQQQQNQHPIQTGHSQAPPGVGGVENQRHFQTHQNLLTHPQHQHHIPVEHHVFHLKCFACSKCASQLRPGDRYYMLGGSLVCEQDWHKLIKTTSTNPPVRKGKVGRPRRSKD